MDLGKRLNILKDSNQISDDTYSKVIKIIQILEHRWGIKLTEENGGMFITHISIAIERIKSKNYVEKLDKNICLEVENNDNYLKSVEVYKDIEEIIAVKIPKAEKYFILMYLCNLVNM